MQPGPGVAGRCVERLPEIAPHCLGTGQAEAAPPGRERVHDVQAPAAGGPDETGQAEVAGQQVASPQGGPADVRELRLAEPDDEDWGLTILVSRAEPSAEQMTRLLDLAVESWGGLAALVAGDVEAADGRMAPTVLQLAPDPQASDGIVANVAPLQITVRPRALSGAEYDAISLLLRAAADTNDVGAEDLPYAAYGAPPWILRSDGLESAAAPRLGALKSAGMLATL